MSNGLHIFAFLCHVYRVPVTKKLPSFPFYEDKQLENNFSNSRVRLHLNLLRLKKFFSPPVPAVSNHIIYRNRRPDIMRNPYGSICIGIRNLKGSNDASTCTMKVKFVEGMAMLE